MKKLIKPLLIGIGAAALAAGAFFGARAVTLGAADSETEAAQAPSDQAAGATLAEFSDYELFSEVPRMAAADARYERAVDDGAGTYGISVYGTTKADYDAYLSLLEADGYERYADNGEGGLEGYVYKTYLQKGVLRLSVTHITALDLTRVTACEGGVWPEHLRYEDSHIEDNDASAKTTLYQGELYDVALSFVIRLKNGRFIINDGGNDVDMPYLIEDLEALTPDGEKPVVEAWFISHAHTDHMGVFKGFFEKKEYLDRIFVENVYFNDMSEEAEKYNNQFEKVTAMLNYVRGVPHMMTSTDGTAPEIHEMSTGDRYYFSDITVDVIFSSEMMADYTKWGNQNGATTWLMYTIEGQKLLFSGDGTFDEQQAIMEIYDSAYFDLDFFTTPHHGYDVFDQFTDHFTGLKTVLYSNPLKWLAGSGMESGSSSHTVALKHLNDISQESYAFGKGTVVFEFPYEVGTAVTMPEREWTHNIMPPSWKWEE